MAEKILGSTKTSTGFKKNGCVEKLRSETVKTAQQWASEQLEKMKDQTRKEQKALDRILDANGFYGVLGFQKVQHIVVPKDGSHLFLYNVSFGYKVAIEVVYSEKTTMRHRKLLNSMGFELIYISMSEANVEKVLQRFVLGIMRHLRDAERVKVGQRRKTLISLARKQGKPDSSVLPASVDTKKLDHLNRLTTALEEKIEQQNKKFGSYES